MRCSKASWLGILLITFLCLSVSDGAAQYATVRGFVADSTTEQVLQGATVVLRNEAGRLYGAATDGDGYFILNRIPAGRYTFRISFVGYAPYEDDLALASGDEVQRQIDLVPRETEIDEVVVTAERDAGVTAVAAGLQSVRPTEIERVPMPGVSGDLASYLQTLPGVVAQGDRGGQFFVRGGTVTQNLALLDGLPVYMPFHILSFYSAFPQTVIDNANLYTGGFGARYGTRLSSVVDVQARKGNKQNLAASASLAPFLSAVRVEGPLVKNKVSVIGSVRQSLLEKIMPDFLGQRFPYRFGDRFAKLHAFVNANHSFSITGLNTFDRGDLAGTKTTFEGNREATAIDDSSEVEWTNTVVGGRYTYLSDALPLLAEVVGGYSEMDNAFGPEDDPERTAEVQSVDLAAHATYFLDAGELRVGVSRRASTLAFELGGQFQDVASAEADVTEWNGYLEADWPLRNRTWRVQPGAHFYAVPDRSQQWIEPRLRLQWRPGGADGRQQFNAAGGLYHQSIVGLSDERDVGNVFTAWVPAREETAAPEAMHAIVGWSMRVTPWLSVATEGFYKDFSNLSVPIFSAFPRFTTELQEAEGTSKGVDLRLNLGERPFWYGSTIDGYVSYSLSETIYDTEQLRYHPAHDRRHQVNALVHAQWGETGLTLQWQYGSGLPFTESGGFDVWYLFTPAVDVTEDPAEQRILYADPFEGRQPPYHRVDLWLERRVEHDRAVATLRAGLVNAFNRDNLFYFDLFTFKRVDQLPLVPSVGFKLEWR